MATSPLLQMPILNATTTMGADQDNPQNKPTPFNLFGSVGAGYRQHQDAPMELYFLAPNVYGTQRTHDGDPSPCDRGKTIFQVWDFNNLLEPTVNSVRESMPLPANGRCFPVRESWIIEDVRGKANYSGKLPPIRPYYGEAGRNFNRFVELYRKPEETQLYPWRAGSQTVYGRFAPMCLYSRFATDKIRDYFVIVSLEFWPQGWGPPWGLNGDGYENNVWGFSENENLIPYGWGAIPSGTNLPVTPFFAVWNLDTFFGYLFEKGINSWATLRNFYYRLKGQGFGGGYTFPVTNEWRTYGYATWWSQCYATILNTRCKYPWKWEPLITNDPLFHFSRVYGISASNFVGYIGCYGAANTNAAFAEQFEQRAFNLLCYLFDSTRCYRKNPQTGGDFYINLPLLWQTFRNQGVYCRSYYT